MASRRLADTQLLLPIVFFLSCHCYRVQHDVNHFSWPFLFSIAASICHFMWSPSSVNTSLSGVSSKAGVVWCFVFLKIKSMPHSTLFMMKCTPFVSHFVPTLSPPYTLVAISPMYSSTQRKGIGVAWQFTLLCGRTFRVSSLTSPLRFFGNCCWCAVLGP